MRDLPLAARLLVLTVAGIAAALVVAAFGHVVDPAPILVFAGLFLLADSLPVGPGAGNASPPASVTASYDVYQNGLPVAVVQLSLIHI